MDLDADADLLVASTRAGGLPAEDHTHLDPVCEVVGCGPLLHYAYPWRGSSPLVHLPLVDDADFEAECETDAGGVVEM